MAASAAAGAPPPTGDPLGDLQEHLRTYSKAVADTIWELQQMKQPEPARVDALADALAGMADRLDGPGGLVDALPDYPRDPACVASARGRGRGGGKRQEAQPRVQHTRECRPHERPTHTATHLRLARSKVKARLVELRAEHDELEPALLGELADIGASHARPVADVLSSVGARAR
jgi:hypothetical protein